MNQFVKLIQDSNKRLDRMMESMNEVTYNRDVMQDIRLEYNTQLKQFAILAQFFGIASKNKRAMGSLEKMNIVDDLTAIDLGVPAGQCKIRCRGEDRPITLEECLDYSGSHGDECRNCWAFQASRKALVDGE